MTQLGFRGSLLFPVIHTATTKMALVLTQIEKLFAVLETLSKARNLLRGWLFQAVLYLRYGRLCHRQNTLQFTGELTLCQAPGFSSQNQHLPVEDAIHSNYSVPAAWPLALPVFFLTFSRGLTRR